MEDFDFSKFKNSCELFNHLQLVNKRYITTEEFKPISKRYQEYKLSIKKSSTESSSSSVNANVNKPTKTGSKSSEERTKKIKKDKNHKHRKTLITDEVYNRILQMDDESGYKLFLTKMNLG